MIVSTQKHVGGYTPCVMEKGKCSIGTHFVPHSEEFPAVLVAAAMRRMQSGPFSVGEVAAAVVKESGGLMPMATADRLATKLFRKFKRPAEDGGACIMYDNSTRSWKWQGRVGGT